MPRKGKKLNHKTPPQGKKLFPGEEGTEERFGSDRPESEDDEAVADKDEGGLSESESESEQQYDCDEDADLPFDCPHIDESLALSRIRSSLLHALTQSSPFYCHGCFPSDFQRELKETESFDQAAAATRGKPQAKGRAKEKAKKKSSAKGKHKDNTTGEDDDDREASHSTAQPFASPADSNASLWVCLYCAHVGCGRSNSKHALEHAITDEKHCLALEVRSMQCWCYMCDIEVNFEASKSASATKLKSAKKIIEDRLLSTQRHDKGQMQTFSSNLKDVLDKFDSSQTKKGKEKTEVKNGIRGLSNLGNTCFFNSVMQNMCRLSLLKQHFLSDQLDMEGPLTTALRKFYHSMWNGEKGTYNPQPLFLEIAKKAPRFRGYQQQDSHELLRYLVDGLLSEDQKRLKISSPADVKTESYINDTFCGKLESSIICKVCRKHMIVHEPFYDISLEIPSLHNSKDSQRGEELGDEKVKFRNRGLTARERKKLEKDQSKGRKERTSQSDSQAEAVGGSDGKEKLKTGKGATGKDESDEYECVESDEESQSAVSRLTSELEKSTVQVDDWDDSERKMTEEQFQAIEARRRKALPPDDTSLLRCVFSFTSPETLTDDEQVRCIDCTAEAKGLLGSKEKLKRLNPKEYVKRDAIKQYLIKKAPPVLVLHLKRFLQSGRNLKKNNKDVPFPLELDLTPFLCEETQDEGPSAERISKYNLSGVVEHSGSMTGGHYVAYVKCHEDWFYISDSSVSKSSAQNALGAQASLLFYEAKRD